MFLGGGKRGKGGLSQGGPLSRGSLSRERGLCPGDICRETPRIRKMGGMHPTRMFSC